MVNKRPSTTNPNQKGGSHESPFLLVIYAKYVARTTPKHVEGNASIRLAL